MGFYSFSRTTGLMPYHLVQSLYNNEMGIITFIQFELQLFQI